VTDWRQIQARIRKAKGGSDPPGQLAALYERTRDAMVAFELAKLHEKSGQNDEAVRWYAAAAERFRRAEWRTKAEEALTRLGASIPASAHGPEVEPTPADLGAISSTESAGAFTETSSEPASPAVEPSSPAAENATGVAPGVAEQPRRRRRGRRGGRGRRRGQGVQGQPSAIEAAAGVAQAPVRAAPEIPRAEDTRAPGANGLEPRERGPAKVAEPAAWQLRGRAGEPAMASRLAHLESQLRRLIASPLHRLDEADQAPAGPGVFVVSDSDQTTYYYIEDCQTLRIGIANLLRAERGGGRRGGESLRTRFAEHLGISESRVSKYLKEHCAVRWLQLDEGAAALAHFAIAVLRPVLND